MALNGTGLTSPAIERVKAWRCGQNLSTSLIRLGTSSRVRRDSSSPYLRRQKFPRVSCFSPSKAVSSLEPEENARNGFVDSLEEETGPVTTFKMSDFMIFNRVSAGLGGRADEMVFEALVQDMNSPFYDTRVVLRQLTSAQAQRRGKRAIEVLKKLVRRRLMYHSYSMQVHGYVCSDSGGGDGGSFTLVHGYHGSCSLRHWLQQSDWLPTLEASLTLDEELVRRVGDHKVGGPTVSRHLRIIRLLMRDLLIGVNYLHSHGLAHTELRLENVHISPVDRHIKIGILGNAADFYEDGPTSRRLDDMSERRLMMIAFDMRCVGFMMAKMVLRELMDPSTFAKFKAFLTKGNNPSCLREFFLRILYRNSASGNIGLQIFDRNWGAGWNLLSLLLGAEPSKRICCLDALRHPFLCGPKWRISPSLEIIRWGLGSTMVRIAEEYIYRQPQRNRLAYFIELMEMLNPHTKSENWLKLLPGKWRLLYYTGMHIGLTLRQPHARSLIGNVELTISTNCQSEVSLSFISNIDFTVIIGKDWPHNKIGIPGALNISSPFHLMPGRRLYFNEDEPTGRFFFNYTGNLNSLAQKTRGKKWRKTIPFKKLPSSLPVAKLLPGDIEVTMYLGDPIAHNVDIARSVAQEVRMQVPPEMFDPSKLVCGTYVDSRLLVLRGVNGSALLFTRSCVDESYT